jgi:hypothetical protein
MGRDWFSPKRLRRKKERSNLPVWPAGSNRTKSAQFTDEAQQVGASRPRGGTCTYPLASPGIRHVDGGMCHCGRQIPIPLEEHFVEAGTMAGCKGFPLTVQLLHPPQVTSVS